MAYKYTYIVECRANDVKRDPSDDLRYKVTYYVGGTNNPRQRIEAHLAGKGAKYLRGREMLRVVMSDLFTEASVKKQTHAERQWIVEKSFLYGLKSFKPFWHRCDHKNAYQVGLPTSIETCPDCKGKGGVFD